MRALHADTDGIFLLSLLSSHQAKPQLRPVWGLSLNSAARRSTVSLSLARADFPCILLNKACLLCTARGRAPHRHDPSHFDTAWFAATAIVVRLAIP